MGTVVIVTEQSLSEVNCILYAAKVVPEHIDGADGECTVLVVKQEDWDDLLSSDIQEA